MRFARMFGYFELGDLPLDFLNPRVICLRKNASFSIAIRSLFAQASEFAPPQRYSPGNRGETGREILRNIEEGFFSRGELSQ